MTIAKSEPALFEGLRVIEVGSFVAAPAAATMLGDLGADIIKIEQPGQGDLWRHQYKRPELPTSDTNYLWYLTGRNKRSLALDLKSKQGQDIFHLLIQNADVFITNLPFKTRGSLGAEYETLEKINAKLIYASFSGYGEHGQERHEISFDTTGWWARSGLMDQARPDPDGPPAKAPAAAGDHLSAVSLYGAIVSALYRREKTGQGAYVGSSLLANGVWQNAVYIQAALSGASFKPIVKREDLWNPLNAVYRCHDDRWFSITINPGHQLIYWQLFAKIMDCPDLLSDERFSSYDARLGHNRELVKILDKAFIKGTAAHWKSKFQGTGIVSSIVAKCEDALTDDQMKANDILVPLQGVEGTQLTVNSPFFIRGQTKRAAHRAPDVGQHSVELLQEVGISDDQIKQLQAKNIVG